MLVRLSTIGFMKLNEICTYILTRNVEVYKIKAKIYSEKEEIRVTYRMHYTYDNFKKYRFMGRKSIF